MNTTKKRNIPVAMLLAELAAALDDMFEGSPPLPEEMTGLIDEGFWIDQIEKKLAPRAKEVREKLIENTKPDIQAIVDTAITKNVGGSRAFVGEASILTVKVNKPAVRVVSDAIKGLGRQEDLIKKGWLKVDEKPGVALSFSERAETAA